MSLKRVVIASRQPKPGDIRTKLQLSGNDTVGQFAEEFPSSGNPYFVSSDVDSTAENIFFVDWPVSYNAAINQYRERWVGYREKEDSMEPPRNITFNLILRFRRSRKTRIPTVFAGQFRARVIVRRESLKPIKLE